MANRTFLLSLDAPYISIPHGAESQDSILAAASYMIPICWYGLFSEQNLAFREAPTDDSGMMKYPVLQSKKDEALARFGSFRSKIAPLFESVPSELFSSYESALKNAPGTWIAVETAEFWMMDEPPAMEDLFRRCLKAVQMSPKGPVGWKIWKQEISAQWQELLGQANIDITAKSQIETFSLFGYSWIKPVPWEQKK